VCGSLPEEETDDHHGEVFHRHRAWACDTHVARDLLADLGITSISAFGEIYR